MVSSGRVLAAGLRAATGYFGVQGHVNDLLSLGARDFIIMMMERKLLEQFQAGETTSAEDDIVIRMQGLQENGGIDAWSGRPPANGWPEDLFQKPAASIPNIIKTVKTINGIFRLLHSTLCNMNNGDALMAAMGVGDTTDKFISPGANVTIIEKLYNVALGSIDSTITFPGVVHGWKNRLSGACAEPNRSKEVLKWSQEVWGAISCHKDEQRACEHDLPAKVSLLGRDHNNASLDITALKYFPQHYSN